MEFEWDEEKDAANRAKHGVSPADAAGLEWDKAQIEPDIRYNYGEARQSALVPLDNRVHLCIYTIRAGRFRIISLRKANAREVKHYETRD